MEIERKMFYIVLRRTFLNAIKVLLKLSNNLLVIVRSLIVTLTECPRDEDFNKLESSKTLKL